MRTKKWNSKQPVEHVVEDIRRRTRRHFSGGDKIRIVFEGRCGADSIAEFFPKEGNAQRLYYTFSKEFMETGQRPLASDMRRSASTDEKRTCAMRLAI